MNTRKSKSVLGVAVTTLALFIGGCLGVHRLTTGSVVTGDRRPGDLCPKFSFIDEEGSPDTFAHVRGAVTLVVFPDDPRWPNCDKCKELVDLAARLERPRTSVVVVSVRSPKDQEQCSAAALHRYDVDWPVQLVALCDHHGCVRDLFGGDALGKFFVVDGDGRIVGRGPLADREALEERARKAAQHHEDEVWAMYWAGEWQVGGGPSLDVN